ncbi:unnamed protein product, partial [marine sediment metagenome]
MGIIDGPKGVGFGRVAIVGNGSKTTTWRKKNIYDFVMGHYLKH